MVWVYHYTDAGSIQGIKMQMTIRKASYSLNGPGVFFTKQRVGIGGVDKWDVAENNYDSGASRKIDEGRLDHVVEVDIPDSELTFKSHKSRGLWIYKEDVDLNKYQHRFCTV